MFDSMATEEKSYVKYAGYSKWGHGCREFDSAEVAALRDRPTDELLNLLFECGREVGAHEEEAPHERSFSVDGAIVKMFAIKDIILAQIAHPR